MALRTVRLLVLASVAFALTGARAEEPQFAAARIKQGADLFARNCATCHGARMRNPQWALDLRQFPHDAHTRFVDSVTNGKRNMPPWEDVFSADEIEALWAYVVAGEPAE